MCRICPQRPIWGRVCCLEWLALVKRGLIDRDAQIDRWARATRGENPNVILELDPNVQRASDEMAAGRYRRRGCTGVVEINETPGVSGGYPCAGDTRIRVGLVVEAFDQTKDVAVTAEQFGLSE